MNTTKIKDLKVPLDVVLGSTKTTVEALSELSVGSIIELNSIAGEPVELRTSGEVIAKGEVVVIEENFGLRVTELLSRRE